MKAQENQLLPFLNGKKQFLIPIYQRTYSWTREQCEQLWQDIIRAATDEDIPAHFLGSVVYIQRGLFHIANVPQLLLIDGQQRLTTLTLLLIALARAAQETTLPTAVSHGDIYDSYLINQYGKDEQRYKLLLTQSDKDILIQLIDHPEKVPSTKTPSRLVENYLFFEEQIRRGTVDPDAIYLGISKLIIVDISLDKNYDNPQLIFESLNSTGMDLSQADLIRNYVLMGLDSPEQAQLYKDYWYPIEQKFRYGGNGDQFDRFMRDYLTLKQGTIPNIDKVYVTFKAYHRSKMTTPLKEFVADITRYAEYFANMAFSHERESTIKQAMQDINTLKVDVAYPFLLEVYDDYINKRLSLADFVAIIRLVESYVFRRAICGIPTNALNKIFSTLAKEIDKEHYLESVQATFLSKVGSGRFPRDDEFRAAFVVKDVYNYPRRNYLLRKLEHYGRKERDPIEGYTIEHIMPQSDPLPLAWQQELGEHWKEVQARYLHTIGNLTLTGYNSELSTRPFQEKRDMEGGFAHSPIKLNWSLAQREHWNKDAIEKRAAALSDEATKVWAIPQLAPTQISAYSKSSKKPPLAEITGPVEHSLAGFIPADFKLVQSSEKRFYLFRKVNDEWVQYGNGKNPWFTISWEYAKKWIKEKFQKNEIPLGVGGAKILPLTPLDDGTSILTDYSNVEAANGSQKYTLNEHSFLQGNMLTLFEQLRKRILNLDVTVREEIKKHYIAYKITTNFVDVEPQKKRLRLTLNVPFDEIDDPKGLTKDLTGIGHYGNGNVEVSLTTLDQLEDIMELVRQAFEYHNEDGLA